MCVCVHSPNSIRLHSYFILLLARQGIRFLWPENKFHLLFETNRIFQGKLTKLFDLNCFIISRYFGISPSSFFAVESFFWWLKKPKLFSGFLKSLHPVQLKLLNVNHFLNFSMKFLKENFSSIFCHQFIDKNIDQFAIRTKLSCDLIPKKGNRFYLKQIDDFVCDIFSWSWFGWRSNGRLLFCVCVRVSFPTHTHDAYNDVLVPLPFPSMLALTDSGQLGWTLRSSSAAPFWIITTSSVSFLLIFFSCTFCHYSWAG